MAEKTIESPGEYAKKIEAQLKACKNPITGNALVKNTAYKAMWFLIELGGRAYACREYFARDLRPKFRAGEEIGFYFAWFGFSAERIARALWEIHRMEDHLGFSHTQLTCVQKEINRSVWQVSASNYWRWAIPMLSYYLGEFRAFALPDNYAPSFTQPNKRLLLRALEKNKPEKIFPEGLEVNWGQSGEFGVMQWENSIRYNTAARERLGIT